MQEMLLYLCVEMEEGRKKEKIKSEECGLFIYYCGGTENLLVFP